MGQSDQFRRLHRQSTKSVFLQADFPHPRKADNYPLVAKSVANGLHKAAKHNMSAHPCRGRRVHPRKIL
jgi:hypothetical protein